MATNYSEGKKRIALTRLTMFKENSANRRSSLVWQDRAGYPRMTIYINGGDRSITGYDNMIIAPMKYEDLNMLVQLIRVIVDEENETKYEIPCYNTVWENGKPTDKKDIQATIHLGKDKNGVIYLSATSEDKTKIKFNIEPDEYIKVFKNGVEITTSEKILKCCALAYAEQLEQCFNNLSTEYSKEFDSEYLDKQAPIKNKAAEVAIAPTPGISEDDLF